MAKEEDKSEAAEEGKGGSSTMKIVIIAVVAAVVLSGGLVGATFYFVVGMDSASAEGEVAEEVVKKPEPPQYHSLDPKFVVSFKDTRSARFMQFSIEVMTRDDEVVKQLDEHSPAIRSSLLMMFDSQSYDQMVTKEGKNALLASITEDVNNTLKAVLGQEELTASVEASYFTEFVIQ